MMPSKMVVCERCGRSYTSISDCEIHLCRDCTLAIFKWVREHRFDLKEELRS